MLSELMDNEISPSMQHIVDEHVKECRPCSEYIENLKHYKELSGFIDGKEVPEELHKRILRDIKDTQSQKVNLSGLLRFSLPVRIAAIAAAIVALVFLAVPSGIYNPVVLKADFSHQVVKSGKGPANVMVGRNAGSPAVRMVTDLAERFGGDVIKDGFNEASGFTDFVKIRVRKDSLAAFTLAFKDISSTAIYVPAFLYSFSKYVDIQIFFPGREFTAMDMNGDTFDDILVYFSHGKNAGRWFVALNNRKGGFESPVKVILHDTLKCLPDQAVILAGDIDGDKFDDLVVQLRFGPDNGKWIFYPNNKKGGFGNGKLVTVDGNDRSFTGINTPVAGDINGDGVGDIGVHVRRGPDAGRWIISHGRGDGTFARGTPLDARFEGSGRDKKYLPFVMDFNADGKEDCGIQWQWGDNYLCGRWFLSINRGYGLFAPEKQVFYALCGEYLILPGDFNGDGYDDICSKSGTPDESGEWLIFLNQKGQKFVISEKKVVFGSEDEFIVK